MKNFLKRKKRLDLPPKYDEFMDLAQEQGLATAIDKVQTWIEEEPEEPAYLRYLTTAYQQLNKPIEYQASAARYFLLKRESDASIDQRRQRVEADSIWLNDILDSEQEFTDAIDLYREIAKLTEGVNTNLYFNAMSKLVSADALSASELKKLIKHCHQAGKGVIGVQCLALLHQQALDHELDISMQADLYQWSGDSEKALALLETVVDINAGTREQLVQLANTQLQLNNLDAFERTLQTIIDRYGEEPRLSQVQQAVAFLKAHGAQLIPIASIRSTVGDVPCYSRTLRDSTERLAWFIDGAATVEGDLALDATSSSYPSGTLGHDLIVHGDLSVTGSVTNFCGDTGCSLVVTGDLEAEHVIGGGSEIFITGDTRIKGALIGHYNHGSITLQRSVCAKLIWNDDHDLNYGFRKESDITLAIGKVIDENHQLLPLLQDGFRQQVLDQIHRDYASVIADEGEDFRYPLTFRQFIAPELLAGRRLSELIKLGG